tara:strand:+ start:2122 stop:2532 length:411 start_codon:yes stop_codon:yes gene_type:complete
MNSLPLTSVFAATFTIIYLFLSFRIGYLRGSPVMKLIFKMEKKIPETKLQRNVRAHGNFSEYVPIFLILLMLLEITALASYDFMLTIALIFLYGRLAHGICFAFYDHNPFLRMSGMITTYLALLIFAIKLVLSVVN